MANSLQVPSRQNLGTYSWDMPSLASRGCTGKLLEPRTKSWSSKHVSSDRRRLLPVMTRTSSKLHVSQFKLIILVKANAKFRANPAHCSLLQGGARARRAARAPIYVASSAQQKKIYVASWY
jgi:hypothetical protein